MEAATAADADTDWEVAHHNTPAGTAASSGAISTAWRIVQAYTG